MTLLLARIKCAVATFLTIVALSGAAVAQTSTLDDLFLQLADPELEDAEDIENQIWTEWSKSGSASADLLLERGREAMQTGDYDLAVEHLSALIDHAPDFAEGYNARATAYFQTGEYGLSVQDIEATLALNPRHFGALSGLAMILEEFGLDDEALRAYRSVNSIHPHRPNVKEAIERLDKELAGTDL